MPISYSIPTPPKELFMHQGTKEQGILKENPVAFIIEKMETKEKGIEVWYRDIPFPRKGFPTPEAVACANIVKRILIETIKTFSYPQFIISWVLALFTYTKAPKIKYGHEMGKERVKVLEKLFLSFNRICYGIMSEYILKPEYMTPLASELQGLIFVFLCRIGIEQGTARQFGLIFGAVIQYDDAYRYRIQDIFSETTKEKLESDPYKEVKRLLGLILERERDWTVQNKYKAIGKLIALPLKLKVVKYALRSALRNCEFSRLQFDEADKYWCKNRTDYNFLGKSYGERMVGFKTVQGLNIVV